MGRDSGIGSVGGTVGRPKLSMGLMGGQPCMEHMVPWDVLHGTRYFEGILGHPSYSYPPYSPYPDSLVPRPLLADLLL